MMNRRKFLFVFVGLTVSGIAFLFVLRNKLYDLKGLISRFINPQLDRYSPVGSLSDAEMKTIISLSEVLIPTVEKSEPNNDLIRGHVNYKTNNVAGYFKEYRNAVKLLDETSKKVFGGDRNFSKLNLSERDRVLGLILWKYRSGEGLKRRLERILSSSGKTSFRDFVVRDLLVSSFRESTAGWAIVGYSHYPGVPAADPRDYSRPLPLSPN